MKRIIFPILALFTAVSLYPYTQVSADNTIIYWKLPAQKLSALADAGDQDAIAEAAERFFYGYDGFAESDPDAFRRLSSIESAGKPAALVTLGIMYKKGFGTPRNEEKARQCFTRAAKELAALAESGDAPAQNKLGLCYLK